MTSAFKTWAVLLMAASLGAAAVSTHIHFNDSDNAMEQVHAKSMASQRQLTGTPGKPATGRSAVPTSQSMDVAADPEDQRVSRLLTKRSLPPSTHQQIIEAARMNREKIRDSDARFNALPADTAWAKPMAANIEQAVNFDIPEIARVRPLEHKAQCRGRTCRIEGRLANDGDASEWINAFSMGISEHLPRVSIYSMPQEDGTTTVVMYAMELSGPGTLR